MNPKYLTAWPTWLVGAFACGAVATAAWATTVVPPSFEQLVSNSDYIVRAVVKSVASEIQTDGQNRHIITKVELEVSEVISGTPPQPLVLEMLGGKVGTEEMVVEGAPQFKVGDEDVLFVHGNGTQFTPLVALMYGRYPVKRDAATGREHIARCNGAALCDVKEIASPMAEAAAGPPAVGVNAQPLSPTDFASLIRTAASNASRARAQH